MCASNDRNSKKGLSKALGLLATVFILIVSYTGAGLFLAYLIKAYVQPNFPSLLIDVICALSGFTLGLFNVVRFAKKAQTP